MKKREDISIKRLEDPKVLIEYSSNIQDRYKNIEGYNPERNCKMLIVLMI